MSLLVGGELGIFVVIQMKSEGTEEEERGSPRVSKQIKQRQKRNHNVQRTIFQTKMSFSIYIILDIIKL